MDDQTPNTSGPKEFPRQWRRILFNRWLLTGVAAIVLYALLGFLLAPWLVKYSVKKYATETLKRNVSMADVHINPFLFTFEVKDFTLREADNRPIFGFSRLFVDFELSSLFRWAWTFADIQIEHPSLYMEIQPNGRLNISALADSFPKSEKAPNKNRQPPRLLLEHAKIVDGNFTFSDHSIPTPATETFTPFNLEFEDISTLPERKGPYDISVKLPGGGLIKWRGNVFLNPLESRGDVNMTGLKLANAWKFIQDKVNLASLSGEADFNTHYQFNYQKHAPLLILQNANLALRKITLAEKDKRTPMLSLEAVNAENMHFDLHRRDILVPRITVRNGKITATMDNKGVLNWQRLTKHPASPKVTPSDPGGRAPDRQAWHLEAQALKIDNIAVDAIDRRGISPLEMSIGDVNILLNASAAIGNGPVQAKISGLAVTLNHTSLSAAGQNPPLFTLDKLSLEDGSIDIGDRAILIRSIKAFGGGTSIVRGKNGRIRLVELLASASKGAPKSEVAPKAEKVRVEESPWSFRLDDFGLNDFKMELKDQTFGRDIIYDLKNIRVSLKHLTNDKKTPIDFDVALKVGQGGSAGLTGEVSQTGDRVDARAKIKRINLKPLHPAVTRFSYLALESGNISSSAHVIYRSEKSGPKLRANGSLSLKGFQLNEADTGQRFLALKEMSASGITFGISPPRLQIKDIKLLEPGAKIVIFKDHRINLAQVIKTSEKAGSETKPLSNKGAPAKPRGHEELFPITIERVRVDNGAVDYADFSLVLPFSTHVTDFNGGATDISSKPGSLASLKFDGKVGEFGFSKVEGRLIPFSPKKFLDITVIFRNVRMEPLSPYSATFAGRKISSGTLDMNLEYKIKNSELLGNNNIVLKQFTLGERVKSPDAIHLPLDLAIALLKDADGKIDVAVPVRGNVDNPKFGYGRVIWQAIVNLITKIVTAPFRALGHLFGGHGEQLSSIAFDPGSARLLPPEMEKIKNVSEALKKRPQLKLVVAARFDPELDGKALRTARVKRELALQTGLKLAPNEEPGPISFDTAKMQEALEKLLKKRRGDNAVSKFVTQYEKETGKKARPMNFAMALVGWKSSDTAFYHAMFNELVKLEPLTDKDLMELARKRTTAIVNQVRADGRLAATRVIAGSPGPVEKPSKNTVNTHLSLDVVKPAA